MLRLASGLWYYRLCNFASPGADADASLMALQALHITLSKNNCPASIALYNKIGPLIYEIPLMAKVSVALSMPALSILLLMSLYYVYIACDLSRL